MTPQQATALFAYLQANDRYARPMSDETAALRIRGMATMLAEVPFDWTQPYVKRRLRDTARESALMPEHILDAYRREQDRVAAQARARLADPETVGVTVPAGAPDWFRAYVEWARPIFAGLRARGVTEGDAEWQAVPDPDEEWRRAHGF